MEEIINNIIDEYKKTGHINFYVVGLEGTGKSHLTHQILEGVCERLNIKPNINMVDVINNISSVKGINLIETHIDGDYKHKVKVLISYNGRNLRKGFYEFYSGDKRITGKFKNLRIFNEEYHKKKQEILRKNLFRE